MSNMREILEGLRNAVLEGDDLEKEGRRRMRYNLMKGIRDKAKESPGMHGVRKTARVVGGSQKPPLPMDAIKKRMEKGEDVDLREAVNGARAHLL